MADQVTKDVVFRIKVEADDSIGEAFHPVEDRTAHLQKLLSDVKLGGLDLTRWQSSIDRANAQLDALRAKALTPIDITGAGKPTSIVTHQPLGGPSSAAAQALSVSDRLTSTLATPAPSSTEAIAKESKSTPQPTNTANMQDVTALKSSFDTIAAAHKEAEEKMNVAAANGAAKRAALNGHAAKIEAEQEAELTRRDDAEAEKRAALPDKIVRNRIAMLARLQQFEASQSAAEKAEADKQIAQLQKRAAAEQKAADQREKDNKKAVDSLIVQWDNEAAAHEKDQQKKLAAANKTLAAMVASGAKAKADDEKAAESASRKREAADRRNEEAAERAARKVSAINDRMRRSLAEAASGATELARGFVEAGLVGEDSMEKVKDSILAVQSAVDLVRGGVGVWHSLSEAARLYGERIEMIAKAEELAAAVRAAHSTTAVAGAAAQGTAAIAGTAAAGGAAAGGASAAGGLAGILAAAGPLGLAFGVVAAAGLGAAYAINKWKEASEEGARRDKEARQKELEAREGQVAALQRVFSAEQRAREQTHARQSLELKISQEFGDKRAEYEERADKAGIKGDANRQQFMANQAAIDQARLKLQQIDEETAEAKKMPERSRNAERMLPADDGRLDEIARERARIVGEMQQRRSRSQMEQDRKVDLDPAATLRKLDEEEVHIRAKKQGSQFGADEQSRVAAAQQLADLARQRGETELQIRELERDGFRQGVAYWNEQLQKQQELIAGDKERVKSAKEYADQTHKAYLDALQQFAMLTKGQQQRLVKIQEKLDRGEQLTRSEQQFGSQHLGEKGREQIREQASGSVDPRIRDALFSKEKAKDADGSAKMMSVVSDASKHIQELTKVMEGIKELNRHAAGGEKAEVKLDAKAHATLELTFDRAAGRAISNELTPQLRDVFADAIKDLLKEATEQIRREWKRDLQRLGQTKAAGA